MELLIVVVVLAILAAIILVSFNGITSQATDSGLKADLNTTAKKVGLDQVETGTYPSTKPSGLPDTIQYTGGGSTFCATASKDGRAFHITENGSIQEGACPGHTVGGGGGGNEIAANSPIQNVTPAQCSALPTFTGSNNDAVRTVTDSRGGETRTYEIAKLADGNCWMLTNLKLGSTTGTITLTPADSDVASNFTLPQLTTSGAGEYDLPRAYGPLTSVGDTGSGSTNYGYLYNWSAVTAGETVTSLTTGNAQHSICPASWRLPSAGVYDTSVWPYALITPGDLSGLDIAFGGTGNWAENGEVNVARWQSSGPFRGLFSGYWYEGFNAQGGAGLLWLASANPPAYDTASDSAFGASFGPNNVTPGAGVLYRSYGLGVRCLLN